MHQRPSYLSNLRVKSPKNGDPDPFFLEPKDLQVFHFTPVAEYQLPEDQLRELDVIVIGCGLAGMTGWSREELDDLESNVGRGSGDNGTVEAEEG